MEQTSSEIDRLLASVEAEDHSDFDLTSGSEIEDNIFSNSGTEYEPSTEDNSSGDEEIDKRNKFKKIKLVIKNVSAGKRTRYLN